MVESNLIQVHILGTSPDIEKVKQLVADNYTQTTHVPVFYTCEGGHITGRAAELLEEDASSKAICIAPHPRFVQDFETFLGANVRPGSYKVKQVGGFVQDSVITDWPSIVSNELINAMKIALENRDDDTSPLNGLLPQVADLRMEVRGHGVALFVIQTPDGKEEGYELKLELRKLDE